MKSFATFIAEVTFIPTSGKKVSPAFMKRVNKEFPRWGDNADIQYVDVGHTNPSNIALKAWGLPPTTDIKVLRKYLPILWWTDEDGKVVTHKIKIGSALSITHGQVRGFAHYLKKFGKMPDYQGRVDVFRKIISIVAPNVRYRSMMMDRALERGKERVIRQLIKLFPGYNIANDI